MLEGQINWASGFLGETSTGGVLELTDDVMDQLKEKYSYLQPAKLGSLLFGPIDDDVPEYVYSDWRDGQAGCIENKGIGGLCGVNANGFRRILACKS